MTRRRRMPVNALQTPAPEAREDVVFEGLVAATAPSVASPALSSPLREPGGGIEEWLETRRLRRAEGIVNARTALALAIGVVPIPVIALAALVCLQLDTIRALGLEYEDPWGGSPGRSLVAALVAAAATAAAATLVGAVLGRPLGLALASAASTRIVGRLFLQHFEAGGTVLGLDPGAMKAFFRRKYLGAAERPESRSAA